jgi:hypothetical protein
MGLQELVSQLPLQEPGGIYALATLGLLMLLTAAYYLRSGSSRGSAAGGNGGSAAAAGEAGALQGRHSSKRILQAERHSDIDAAQIAAECKTRGEGVLWKDPSFGHDAFPGGSIGDLELKDGERGKPLVIGDEGVTWQPPSKFCATSRPMGVRGDGVGTWLYSDADGDGVVSAAESMLPTDIVQGSVGDCYFLSALAAVVFHHPDLADDLIDETYEEQGMYGVSFWQHGSWRMTWVDSYFPCYRPSGRTHSGKHKLIFASGEDHKEIWPMVVEKAFAKQAGSYEAISGGQVSAALEMLTGGKGRRRDATLSTSGEHWEQFMAEVKSDNYFVGAGSKQLAVGAAEAAEQKKQMQGIVTGHAYTVLNVYEGGAGGADDDDQAAPLRLVELRNPWGRGEWSGDWGRGSRLWDSAQGKQVIVAHGPPPSQDGRFWMDWVDFTRCFDSIDTCHMNFSEEDRARRSELAAEAARILAKGERPQAAAAGGGGGAAARGKGKGGASGPDDDDGPVRTQESADAMMAQLLAEDAKEKRMKHVGARGGKKKATKKGKQKK